MNGEQASLQSQKMLVESSDMTGGLNDSSRAQDARASAW